MSAVLGPLHLDQLPKSKPVTPMFSCRVSPWPPARGPKPSPASRYRLNTGWPTGIPRRLGRRRGASAAGRRAEEAGRQRGGRDAGRPAELQDGEGDVAAVPDEPGRPLLMLAG